KKVSRGILIAKGYSIGSNKPFKTILIPHPNRFPIKAIVYRPAKKKAGTGHPSPPIFSTVGQEQPQYLSVSCCYVQVSYIFWIKTKKKYIQRVSAKLN